MKMVNCWTCQDFISVSKMYRVVSTSRDEVLANNLCLDCAQKTASHNPDFYVQRYGFPESQVMINESKSEPHYHRNNEGKLIACYHYGRSIATNWKFWASMTLSFPLEHALWEYVPPFSYVTQILGL